MEKLSGQSRTHQDRYQKWIERKHFCLNCLNGFWPASPQSQDVFWKKKMVYDKWYREEINQRKTERKDKTPYRKINTYIPSGWCVHSTIAHGDVLDPVKVEEHVKVEVKGLNVTFPQQSMIELTNVFKSEHEVSYTIWRV